MHPIQYPCFTHSPQRFSVNGMFRKLDSVASATSMSHGTGHGSTIIMGNVWMAGKCTSVMCTRHLISHMQASYIMHLKNGQKHWLWWNTSNSLYACDHYSPTVWSVTVRQELVLHGAEQRERLLARQPPHQSLICRRAGSFKPVHFCKVPPPFTTQLCWGIFKNWFKRWISRKRNTNRNKWTFSD